MHKPARQILAKACLDKLELAKCGRERVLRVWRAGMCLIGFAFINEYRNAILQILFKASHGHGNAASLRAERAGLKQC
jgi:hypothetical protein